MVSNYIQEIKQGNHLSFEIVFKLYHKKVYAYFFKKTICQDQAEELTQLAFIKLWKFKHTLSEDFTLDVQLFKIARTTLLDYFKKVACEEKNLRTYHSERSESMQNVTHPYDNRQQLEVVLGCLPPTRKQVFVLNRLHGYSYKEIAEKLSISPRTVEKHISLAVKQLGYVYLPILLVLLLSGFVQ